MKNVPEEFGIITYTEPTVKLNDIEYADDSVTFSENQFNAIHYIEALRGSSKKRWLKDKSRRTCFMTNIKDETEIESTHRNLLKDFKYFGSQIISSSSKGAQCAACKHAI
jgi:hypothetical protein